MIIASHHLPKYIPRITFPVKIVCETGMEEALRVERTDFLALVEAKAIVGVGSWRRLKYCRLNRPLSEISLLRAKLRDRPPMAEPLHYRDRLGDTMSLVVVKRTSADGTWHRWDNDLTFRELRQKPSPLISEERKEARDEERRQARFRLVKDSPMLASAAR